MCSGTQHPFEASTHKAERRPFVSIPRRLLAALGFLLSFGFLLACHPPIDESGRGAPSNEKSATPQRDFGQEIFKFLIREARLHPTLSSQRVRAVETIHGKWNVPTTINKMVPPGMLGDLEGYLRALLPFYDDNTLASLTGGGAAILNDLLKQEEVLKALLKASQRTGLTPPLQRGEGSLLHRMMSFPKQKDFLLKLVTWARNNDGFEDDGRTPNSQEKPLLKDFLKAFSELLLRTNYRDKNDQSADLLMDILLLQDPRLDLGIGKRCAVRFDTNGSPIRTTAGQQAAAAGNLIPPFGPAGGARGQCGEALGANNQPLYDTRDLSKTVLGTLLSDGRTLILRDLPLQGDKIPFPFNLTVGIKPLLEPVDPATGGFSDKSPMIKTIKSLFPLLRGPRLYKLLETFAILAEKNESDFAALLGLFEDFKKIADKYPNAKINPDSKLFDDLLPLLQEFMAIPGFLEDLLKALQTPGLTPKLEQGMIQMMRYRKNTITPEDFVNFKNGQKDAIFKEQVQPNKPDVRGNLSYMQRLLHVIADVHRHSYKSKLKSAGVAIPLIEMRIDDLALMYIRAVAGKISIWETVYINGEPADEKKHKFLMDTLKKSFPIMGLSENPDPEQLALFLNKPLNFKDVPLVAGLKIAVTLDPLKCREGYKVREHHGDSLLAGIASGLVAKDGGALRPIAQVFAKYNKLPRLLDLFGILHKHWGTAGNDEKSADGKASYPTPRTGMRNLEPILLEATETTGMLKKLETLGKGLLDVRLTPGDEKAAPYLQNYLAYILGKAGTPRDQTPLGPALDGLDGMQKALEGPAKAKARDAWNGAISALSDLLLQVEGEGAQARFKNRRAPVILARVLKFMATEVEKRDKAGDWGPELGRMERKIQELLIDPVLPSTLNLLDAFTQQRELLQLTTDMLLYVMPDPQKEPKQFGELLSLGAGLLAPTPDDIHVPVARFLGSILLPERHQSLIIRLVVFLQRSIPLDEKGTLLALMRNAAIAHDQQNDLLMGMFPSLFSSLLRQSPGSSEPIALEDLRQITQTVARFLIDDQKGMEKLYKIVKNRNGPTKK